jgi:phytanoyl-CoA hydroxylase
MTVIEDRSLNHEEIEALRIKAKEVFAELEEEFQATDEKKHFSWLNATVSSSDGTISRSDQCRYFDEFGFLLLRGFASPTQVQSMKDQMESLTDEWDPAEKTMSFSTDENANENHGSDDYFLESASRVHFFAEPTALEDGGSLKEEYKKNKLRALNKAGHAMHIIPGAFCDYTQSPGVQSLVADLGWDDPVVPQSMYICKNAHIGGVVHSHQDSTFLFTEPRQSCLGLWLALDDATLQNGCLWVRPKSHREPVRRQFKRNEEHFTQEVIDEGSNVGKGNLSEPKMIIDTFRKDIAWEGQLPDNSESPCQGLLDAGFIPVECNAGDLLVFPGELDHLSLPNFSDQQRHTFQLHLVEGPGAGVTWSKNNWLQYPKGTQFISIKAK